MKIPDPEFLKNFTKNIMEHFWIAQANNLQRRGLLKEYLNQDYAFSNIDDVKEFHKKLWEDCPFKKPEKYEL